MSRVSGFFRYSLLVVGLVLIDQSTKWAARHLLMHRSITAGPFGLVLTMNEGVAFGMFGGERWVVPLNAVLGIVVCVAAVAAMRRGEHGLSNGLLLVFAGFAGNFVDRLASGQVTDFLWIRGWSVFNFADSLVTVGAILCALALLYPNRWGFHE